MLSDAILPVVAATFFLGGVSILLLLLLNIFRGIRGEARGRKTLDIATSRIDLKRGIAFTAALLLIGAASMTSWINRELRLYSPVVPGIPLGTISILNERGTLPQLVYASTDRQGREALEVLPVRDAMFRLRGERIRWSPKLRFLGMGEYFKLSRIEFYPHQNTTLGPSSFAMDVRQGSTRLYRYLEKYHNWLPFVQVDSIETEIWDAWTEYSRHLYLRSNQIVSN